MPSEIITITEGREYLAKHLSEGVNCPCCGQRVQLWRKSIISTAVASLCRLVSQYRGKPIHHDNFTVLLKDRNFSQLVLWGLVEPAAPRTNTDNSAGKWSPTGLGVNFVNNRARVFKYINTYNNHLFSFEGPKIDVMEALRQKFDYAELLGIQGGTSVIHKEQINLFETEARINAL